MTSKEFSAFPTEGLAFLRSLKRNNKREWFQERKGIYEAQVREPMLGLISRLSHDFQKFAPEMIAAPKESMYRIYRDTRFSKDKTPYKTHVAAVFPRQGLGKHEGAAFYVHIDVKEVLIGGGLYMPLPEDLHAIRNHIAENPRQFRKIVEGAAFRKLFGRLWGDQLSRVPRGFPVDHPVADYLRYKQFLASRTMKAEFAATAKFYPAVVETFRAMTAFIRFINEPLVVTRRARNREQSMLSLD